MVSSLSTALGKSTYIQDLMIPAFISMMWYVSVWHALAYLYTPSRIILLTSGQCLLSFWNCMLNRLGAPYPSDECMPFFFTSGWYTYYLSRRRLVHDLTKHKTARFPSFFIITIYHSDLTVLSEWKCCMSVTIKIQLGLKATKRVLYPFKKNML
jgi:hypothetical protein